MKITCGHIINKPSSHSRRWRKKERGTERKSMMSSREERQKKRIIMKKKCIYSEICTRVVCVNRGKMYRILYYMAGKGTFAIALHVLVYPSKAITMRQFWAAWQFAEIHMIRSRYIRSQQSFTYYTIAHTQSRSVCMEWWNSLNTYAVCGRFSFCFKFKPASGWMDGCYCSSTYVQMQSHQRNAQEKCFLAFVW